MNGSLLRAVVLLAVLAIAGCGGGQPTQTGPDQMTAPWTAAEVLADIDAAKATVSLPPGFIWHTIKLDGSGSYGAFAGRSMIEFQAACAWFSALVSARAAGDQLAIAASAAVVRGVPTWKTFSDPALIDAASSHHVADLVAAALEGDQTGMRSFIAANCGP